MKCLGRTNAFSFRKRCNRQTVFFFCWHHSWQLILSVVAIVGFIATVSEFYGYGRHDIFAKKKVHSKPEITCSLEYPTHTEDDKGVHNKRNPDVVISNRGLLKASSISGNVKVYRYDSEKDDITAAAVQSLKTVDHAISGHELKALGELRHSTLGFPGENLLAIYIISVDYYVEPNMQPVNLINYFFVENHQVENRSQFQKDARYDHIMQKLRNFDISQEPTSPTMGVGQATVTKDKPTSAPIPPPPAALAPKKTPSEPPILETLSAQVQYVYRSGGTDPILPIRNGEELNSGDHYKIFFRANRDCYVYIYQIDAPGNIFRLFPIKQFDGVTLNHQNPVKGGSHIVLPSKDRFFYLDNTIGKETFYFVASLQRNLGLETIEKKMRAAQSSTDPTQISKVRKDMTEYLTSRGNGRISTKLVAPVAWQSDLTPSPVIGHRLGNLDQDSLHRLEFWHR